MTEEFTPFDRLFAVFEDDHGFIPSYYNDAYLSRRLDARMRRVGVEKYDEYGELRRSDPDERAALLDSVSITVTGFCQQTASVVDTVIDSLDPGGYLAIVNTETIPTACATRLVPVDNRLRIYRPE